MFYKFVDHPAVAAYKKFQADSDALGAKARAFAAQFGPETPTCFFRNRGGHEFAGITFKPKKVSPFWTVAREQTNNFQRPKESVVGKKLAERDEHKALLAKWKAEFPRDSVVMTPIFEAMGAKVSFLDGYQFFVLDDVLYYSGDRPATAGTEILGSEFSAALAAIGARNAALKDEKP